MRQGKSLGGPLGALSCICGLLLLGAMQSQERAGNMFNFRGLDGLVYIVAATLIVGGIWAVIRAIGSGSPND